MNDENGKKYYFKIHFLWSFFTISGEDRVKRELLTKEAFFLPDDAKVAKYDENRVARYWNKMNVQQRMWRQFLLNFVSGLFIKLIPVILVYIAIHYVSFEILYKAYYECAINKTNTIVSPNTNINCTDGGWPQRIKLWSTIETHFSKILTFFIGFFVAFSIRSWFTQLKMIPRFDVLTMGLDTFLWVDSTKQNNSIHIKENVTVKELQMTIMRYCFLSWTMCLSRISTNLSHYLNKGNAYTFNKKGLLVKREFDQLNFGTKTDSWLDNWATPLLWANKMVNDLDTLPKFTTDAKIKDLKEGITTNLRKFTKDLEGLTSFNEYRTPPGITNILVIAMWFFVALSAISSHDIPKKLISEHNVEELLLDFPVFELMKFILLFGWLKTAVDLQNPFGMQM